MLFFELLITISQNFVFFIQMPSFSILIQNWYRQNQRDLPWRKSRDPYKIWISEVILQQTRIEQGLSYYLKFTENFPQVTDLADAEEDHVLNLWQGLGYYSRARNMHAAAKLITDEFNGIFPTSYTDIRSLKGVGDYTAAAIASIAYNLPYAVVDGNVYRFLGRYLAISTPIDSGAGKKEFAEAAALLLDTNEPGTHNQAMMEIGALVCTPKNPNCPQCPVNESCMAYEKGNQLDFPVKAKKTKVRNRFINYLVIHDGQQLIIKKRSKKGIWQGLYDFPEIEYESNEALKPEDLEKRGIADLRYDGEFTHILSHQKILAKFWLTSVKELKVNKGEQIIPLENLEDFPMPQLLIRYLESSSFFKGD